MLTVVQVEVESKWTNDTQHLLLEHFDIIQNSPSHIYHSALPLFPSSSCLHRHYTVEPSPMIKVVRGLPTEWGGCSRTVFLDSYTLTISYHNGSIAIGSASGDIIVLDSTTGTQRAVLSGHSDVASCVEFSSDGTLLISGSHDKTVKLWDIQTGGVVRTFSGHTDLVQCVSISVDCTKIVSGSHDQMICLWEVQTGKCYYTIEGHDITYQIRFSPTNPQCFISASSDRVCQWDTNGNQIEPPHLGSGIAFSPGGTQFVSYYWTSFKVWNVSSGAVVSKFSLGELITRCCCFSPDSRLIAVATGSVIYIWNIASSCLVRTFIGHTHEVNSIVFSSPSNLISVSLDKSVKFWQVYTSVELVTTSQESTPTVLPLISSLSLQAREGIVISGDADGVVQTWDISTGLDGMPSQDLTKGSGYGDTKLVNSKLIFVWYAGEMLNIWNTEKGEFVLQLCIPKHSTLDLRISGDGSKILHIHNEFIQAWDVWTGATARSMEYKDWYSVELLAVDGSRVWIEYSEEWAPRMTTGWDFGRLDQSPVMLNGRPSARLGLSGTKLWDTNPYRILDTVTGKVVFQLPTQCGRPVDVKWNNQYLVISFLSKEELVLELHPTLLQ